VRFRETPAIPVSGSAAQSQTSEVGGVDVKSFYPESYNISRLSLPLVSPQYILPRSRLGPSAIRTAGAHEARPICKRRRRGGGGQGESPRRRPCASRRRASASGPRSGRDSPRQRSPDRREGRSGLPSGARGPRRRGSHSSIRRTPFEVRIFCVRRMMEWGAKRQGRGESGPRPAHSPTPTGSL